MRVRDVIRTVGPAPWVMILGAILLNVGTWTRSDTVTTIAAFVLLTGVAMSWFNIRRLRRSTRNAEARRQEWEG